MGKYIRMTKTYLVVVTVFILSRFLLEAVGPEYISWLQYELEFDTLVSEISLTRLFWVLPIFLGVRFAYESLGGWKEMVIANFTYVIWGMVLLTIVQAVDITLALGTHYQGGQFIGTTIGRVISLSGWGMHAGAPGSNPTQPNFCVSILMTGVLTNVLCFITIKLNGKVLGQAQEFSPNSGPVPELSGE